MHFFTPMFAEIADKMPTLAVVRERWIFIGLLAALVTAVLSMIRLWIGGVIVGLCVVLGLIASASDGIMDTQIALELGADYLFQQRISSFVPSLLGCVAWIIVWLIRRPDSGAAAPARRAVRPPYEKM